MTPPLAPAMLGAVAAGGAVGAVLRYLMMSLAGHLWHGAFPWGTLAVNVLGSFLMGVVVRAAAVAWTPPAELRAFVVVGLLGAFTTFSTFSLDVWFLAERQQYASAAAYTAASVVLSVAGLVAGILLTRWVTA